MLLFAFSCVSMILFAQDSTSKTITRETTSTTTTTEWYAEPWVWAVGGGVLLIVIIALLRSGSSSRDREVTRTTVIKDDRGY
jgi:hypothetical protein